ncbi:MAG: hypothetical protein R6V53_04340 [Candidatus Woesearchaeota archaeon]
MSKPNILEEKPISLVEVKSELKKIKKRDGEYSFRANKTEEYLNHFANITQKKAKDIYKGLSDLNIPRFKDVHMIKIIDLLPDTVDDVKIALQGFTTLTVSQENMKKIAKVVSDNS